MAPDHKSAKIIVLHLILKFVICFVIFFYNGPLDDDVGNVCFVLCLQMNDIAALAGQDVLDRIAALEKENADLRQTVKDLKNLQLNSDSRLKALETRLGTVSVSDAPATKPAAAPAAADDDDVDLFGSDDEEDDEEAAKLREQRLAEYAAKKSKKPALIAKSNVILDVKPWVILITDYLNSLSKPKYFRSLTSYYFFYFNRMMKLIWLKWKNTYAQLNATVCCGVLLNWCH